MSDFRMLFYDWLKIFNNCLYYQSVNGCLAGQTVGTIGATNPVPGFTSEVEIADEVQ